ncbi:MAG: DUF1810 domain-containing protein [Terracidiphilus sp.]|jgi:uncharacterized protein (DUF1810 family)
MQDPFNLERFVSAQAAVFPQVLAELRAGEKRSHWIWIIFPQMKGLGHSSQSEYYGIGSIEEAMAYTRHPQLGPRLVQSTELVNLVKGRTINQILGSPDDLKFRSSMTLFARAVPDTPAFAEALKKYFNGDPDPLTLKLLR